MSFFDTAYILSECSQPSAQDKETINGVSDLRVKTNCARRVQVTNTKIEYHALLLHLFSQEREKGGDNQNRTIAIRTPGIQGIPHHPIINKNLMRRLVRYNSLSRRSRE